jgi:hypothetical protein
MKTLKFESFAKYKIQEKELNYLKGGINGPDDDILVPPRK